MARHITTHKGPQHPLRWFGSLLKASWVSDKPRTQRPDFSSTIPDLCQLQSLLLTTLGAYSSGWLTSLVPHESAPGPTLSEWLLMTA